MGPLRSETCVEASPSALETSCWHDCKGALQDINLRSHPLQQTAAPQPHLQPQRQQQQAQQQPQRQPQREQQRHTQQQQQSSPPDRRPPPAPQASTPRQQQAAASSAANGAGTAAETDDDDYSTVSETNETEVIFAKDAVSIRPTRSEAIAGRLSILRQQRMVFLAWLPYSQGCLQEDGTFQPPADAARSPASAVDRTAYAVHPLPLSDVQALRKHVPSFGTHHVVVVLGNGLTLPPLFFGQGGVRAMFSALKQHVALLKSNSDANTYLVVSTSDPLQRSLMDLELKDHLLASAHPHAMPNGPSEVAPPQGGLMDSIAGSRLGAWGQLHRVTQLAVAQARDTTSSFFAAAPDVPGGVLAPDEPHLAPGPSVLLAAAMRQSSGRQSGGSPQEGRRGSGTLEFATDVGRFEVMDRAAAQGGGLARRRGLRSPPLSLESWGALLGPDGQLADERGFRARIFLSGCDTQVRREAWKFLLGLYPADMSAAARAAAMEARRSEYDALQQQWTSISDRQAARFAKWRERRTRVDKDVRRTDRGVPFFAGSRNPNVAMLRRILLTYSIYNFDLSYCQGMSDLAAPLLYVMRDEAEAFWAFSALMDRCEQNFNTDCTGMHRQLGVLGAMVAALDPELHAFLAARDATNYFFTYRWMLIYMKREFAFDEVLRLWEAVWAAPQPHFHMWVVLAVLQHHRKPLMEAATDYDGLLKYCIQLSGKLDVETVLTHAEALAEHAGPRGRALLAPLDQA